jgi:hypothetical protein
MSTTTLTTLQRRAFAAALRAAKNNAYCRQVGGFVIVQMSDGSIDWFPLGQTPHQGGEPDKGAVILGRWRWNYQRWSRIG